jgi:hypothetical protein
MNTRERAVERLAGWIHLMEVRVGSKSGSTRESVELADDLRTADAVAFGVHPWDAQAASELLDTLGAIFPDAALVEAVEKAEADFEAGRVVHAGALQAAKDRLLDAVRTQLRKGR